MDIEVGDVVRLRGNGLQMTVIAVSGDNVTTSWIDNTGKESRASFPAASLVNISWKRKKQAT